MRRGSPHQWCGDGTSLQSLIRSASLLMPSYTYNRARGVSFCCPYDAAVLRCVVWNLGSSTHEQVDHLVDGERAVAVVICARSGSGLQSAAVGSRGSARSAGPRAHRGGSTGP